MNRLDTRGSGPRLALPALPAWVALAAFPVAMLPLPSVANACFALLVAWSLLAIGLGGGTAASHWLRLVRAEWPMMLAMAGMPLAIGLHQAVALRQAPDVPYLYLRFALFALLAWGLLQMGPERVRRIQWGFVAGAIVSAVWIHLTGTGHRPQGMGQFNVIPFGNLSLMMGMLSLAALGWTPPHARLEAAVKLLAGAAGLYASLMSGTRGGWLAIPLLAVIVLTSAPQLGWRAKALALATSLGILGLAMQFSDLVRRRVFSALDSLLSHVPGAADSSVSLRFELWEASLAMFRSHPLAGVGPEGFGPALDALAGQGVVSSAAATLSHSHNDVLYAMATLGLPGLAAALAMYVVPAWFFLSRIRSGNRDMRVAASMGLALCAGFAVFGLTEAMFVIALTNAFYSLVMAACFAIVVGVRADRPA